MAKNTFIAAAILAGSALSPHAIGAGINFGNPSSSEWGNWLRGDAGSLYAHWDLFTPPSINSIPIDTTPDQGQFGLFPAGSANPGAILFTKKRDSAQAPAAFITGSSNIYSFSDALEFDVILQPTTTHQNVVGNNPVIIALQISVLGEDLDDATVMLNGGTPFATKTVLSAGGASGPDGQGGVDNEYLYLWEFPIALPVYILSFAAAEASLSLDAVSIDIGPGPNAVDPNPVPLPSAVWMLGVAMTSLLAGAKCRR